MVVSTNAQYDDGDVGKTLPVRSPPTPRLLSWCELAAQSYLSPWGGGRTPARLGRVGREEGTGGGTHDLSPPQPLRF